MQKPVFQSAQNLIKKYYKVVDITQTRGFTAVPNRAGNIAGKSDGYEYPLEALALQREIMLKNNELIESGSLNEFLAWLGKYERNLMKKAK